ncbi:MAG: hypothetical protein GDA42_13080 [Ekhidna sp.]|nr:hypothetical protein [Ekhidna sp.]
MISPDRNAGAVYVLLVFSHFLITILPTALRPPSPSVKTKKRPSFNPERSYNPDFETGHLATGSPLSRSFR